MAKKIKREILVKERLTCSIGVGPNKLLAKVASDLHKPDGLTIVQEAEAEQFLAPLPVRRLLWVGRKTEKRLKALGVTTIGELSRYDPIVLTETFGVLGTQMHLMAKGIDKSKVETRGEIKSISHETTFEEDTNDSEKVLKTLDALSEEIAKEILIRGFSFKTVTVKLRYENFETHTSARTFSFMTNRARDMQKTARDLLQPFLKKNRKVRLIGIRVSTLAKGDSQKTLV